MNTPHLYLELLYFNQNCFNLLSSLYMNIIIKKALTLTLLILLLPITTLSAETATVEEQLHTSSLQSAATNQSLYRFPRVLGHSTDETSTRVTRTLEQAIASEYEDITIEPPTGWSVSEEIDADGIFSTYILNENYTAQIAIHRIYDPEVTLDSLTEEIEAVCEVCGYTIEDKEEVTFLEEDGIFFAVQADGERFDQYATVIDDVAYIATISAGDELWDSYKAIMTKSIETLEVISVEPIKTTPIEPEEVDTDAFEAVIALIEAEEFEQAEVAIIEAVANPETDPFTLYGYSIILFYFLENREQAAFVFHVAQLRSGAFTETPDDSDSYGYFALRSSLDSITGEVILPWLGSDIEAWKKLAQTAINFEQTLGYPTNLLGLDEAAWEELVDDVRDEYQAGMEEYLLPVTESEARALRAENGLSVGPWEGPGDPVPVEWR